MKYRKLATYLLQNDFFRNYYSTISRGKKNPLKILRKLENLHSAVEDVVEHERMAVAARSDSILKEE